MKVKIAFVVIAFIIVLLTIIRENIFLEINALLNKETYNKAYFYWFNSEFKELSSQNLYRLKWGLTILFSLTISVLSILGIKIWFRNREYTWLVIQIYLFIILALAFISAIVFIVEPLKSYYFVARKLIGFLQSPILLFLFFGLFYYIKTSKNTES